MATRSSTNMVLPSASPTSIFWNMNDHLSNPAVSLKSLGKPTASFASPMARLMSTIAASVRWTVEEAYYSPVEDLVFTKSVVTVLISSLVEQGWRRWGEAAPHSLIMVTG